MFIHKMECFGVRLRQLNNVYYLRSLFLWCCLGLMGFVCGAAEVQYLDSAWQFVDDPAHTGLERGLVTNFPQQVTASKVSMPFAAWMWAPDGSSAWLCKDFVCELPKYSEGVIANRRVRLVLGGVNYRCRAWLNGRFLGQHDGPCGSFGWEVSDILQRDSSNRLVMNIETTPANGTIDGLRYNQLPITEGHAYMQEVPRLIQTDEQSIKNVWARANPENGVITLQITSLNAGKKAVSLPLRIEVSQGEDMARVATYMKMVNLSVGEGVSEVQVKVPHVRLWSVKDPNLYRVAVRLGMEEEYSLRVGFRTLRIDDAGYFELNGQRIFLKCAHTLPAFPDAPFANVNKERCRQQLLYFKACGYNAIRYLYCTSYPEMMSLCDEIGLLVYEEHAFAWLKKTSDRAEELMRSTCRDVILRDRNHASFAIFGFLNETEPTDEKRPLIAAVDKILPEMRVLAPDTLFLFQSGRWEGQLGRASASNPGSSKWDAWMGDEGTDHDLATHNYGCDGVGDMHYYPAHPVGLVSNRDFLQQRLSRRRAVFLSESGAGSQVNMVAGYLKFDMLGWSKTANAYDCVRQHALGFRNFFDTWQLNKIWSTPEAFIYDSQQYETDQRQLLTAMIRRNPGVSGYSMTMAMDKEFRGEGLMDVDGTFKRGASEYLQSVCADLMWCITVRDACVFDTVGLDLDVALSDYGMLKPNVSYPVRLRVTSHEGVKWEKRLEFSVKADENGHTPTATKIFAEHLDTTGWASGDYEFTAEFLEGAFATCGQKKLHVIARADTAESLKGKRLVLVGNKTAACKDLIISVGGSVAVGTFKTVDKQDNTSVSVATLKFGDVVFVASDVLSDDEVTTLWNVAKRGVHVIVAKPEALAGKDGILRLPFQASARTCKEWNWLYHYEGIVHNSIWTAGVKNRMIFDTEYFGALWTDTCITGLPVPDMLGFSCVYLGIDGNRTKNYYDGMLLGGYKVGEGRVTLSTLNLTLDDPVALRVWVNILSK